MDRKINRRSLLGSTWAGIVGLIAGKTLADPVTAAPLEKAPPVDPNVVTYSYDVSDNSTIDGDITTYTYDGTGQLIQVTHSSQTTYCWEGGEIG